MVAVVTPSYLYVANCGDSRAVICKDGMAVSLFVLVLVPVLVLVFVFVVRGRASCIRFVWLLSLSLFLFSFLFMCLFFFTSFLFVLFFFSFSSRSFSFVSFFFFFLAVVAALFSLRGNSRAVVCDDGMAMSHRVLALVLVHVSFLGIFLLEAYFTACTYLNLLAGNDFCALTQYVRGRARCWDRVCDAQ